MKPFGVISSLLLALLLCSQGSARAVTIEGPVSWGTLATSATGQCNPACSNIDAEREAGGPQQSGVSTELDDAKGLSRAQAILNDAPGNYTPILRALANANAGANVVEATATGVQSYNNTGGDRTILLNLSLDADLSGDARSSAQVAVFLNDSLAYFRNDFGTTAFEPETGEELIASAQLFGQQSSDLSFFVGAGQDFLIWAGLQVSAESGGTADAFNTFTVDIVDATGLVAASSAAIGAVPLPAGAWLFLSGIGFVAGLSRRRKNYRAG